MDKINTKKLKVVGFVIGGIVSLIVCPIAGIAALFGIKLWPYIKKWLYT